MSVRTGPHVNVPSFTPACKETAVRMTVLADKEESPLSRLNFRYCGKRTPQPGVEVERKWKRLDYIMPKGEPMPAGEPVHAAPKHR